VPGWGSSEGRNDSTQAASFTVLETTHKYNLTHKAAITSTESVVASMEAGGVILALLSSSEEPL
jgi:hypothetical protein